VTCRIETIRATAVDDSRALWEWYLAFRPRSTGYCIESTAPVCAWRSS